MSKIGEETPHFMKQQNGIVIFLWSICLRKEPGRI